MRLLADESCDARLAADLRALGHDVRALEKPELGSMDDRVIDIARAEHRILLTEDKDFGQLVFSAARPASGVILIRARPDARSGLVSTIGELLAGSGDSLYGSFVVVEPGRVRINSL